MVVLESLKQTWAMKRRNVVVVSQLPDNPPTPLPPPTPPTPGDRPSAVCFHPGRDVHVFVQHDPSDCVLASQHVALRDRTGAGEQPTGSDAVGQARKQSSTFGTWGEYIFFSFVQVPLYCTCTFFCTSSSTQDK